MKSLIVFLVLFSPILVSGQVTVFLAGDSTCANKTDDRRPETGWGEKLGQFFDPAKVKIDNRALNGRSTKSFIDEGRWQSLIETVKKGDYVFIEFGHNDEKKDKPAVYASPEAYKENLTRFIREVRAKRATPVLLTPVARRKFEGGVLVKTHGEYPDSVKEVGRRENVPVIDMETKSSQVLTSYGEQGSTKLFLQLKPGEHANYPNGVVDNTHFSPLGADEMAKLVVSEIRENRIKLAKMLKK